MIHSLFDRSFKAILLLVLIAAAFILPLFIVVQPPHPMVISEGWQYRYGDSEKNAQGVPLWVYDSKEDSNWKSFSCPGQPPVKADSGNVWLRTQLPTKDWEIPSIMFTTNDQLFEVYIEDKLIYKFGDLDKHDDSVAPGSPWHLIRLPEDYHGKTIYLRMHTSFSRNMGLVRRFEIGSQNEHYSYLVANEIDNLLLTTLFTFLGFSLVFIYMLRRSVNYEFPALGLFSISIGIWLLAETNFKQLFLNAPRFWLYVAFLSFYLMPIGFMIFVERVFSPGNIYLKMMCRLNIVFTAVTLLLDVTRLVPFIFTLQAFYVVLFLSIVTIFVTIMKAAKSNSYETKVFVWGFSLFSLFGFYDVLGMYFRVVPWSQYIIPYGMFIFLLSMIYILGRRFAEVYDKLKVYSEDIKNKNEALHEAYKQVNESKNKLSEWNKGLEQTVQKRTASIRNLLDNAGQGFLTFGADLAVDAEFSSECYNIFGCNINGRPFPELIYPNNPEEQEFLNTLIANILDETDEMQRNIYLSLLPEEVTLNGKCIQVSYKIIADKDINVSEVFMVILTDITYKRMLEDKVEQERNVLKMVVKVITNYDDFAETVKDYREFCSLKLPKLISGTPPNDGLFYDICREIHTFKGTFSIFDMSNIAEKLHDFETELSECKDSKDPNRVKRLLDYLSNHDIKSWLDADINILKSILGDQFLIKENTIVIEKSKLLAIEEKMLLLLSSAECRLLLPDIRRLRQKPFKEILKGIPAYAGKLADKLDKMLNPVEIKAEDILVDLDRYQGFAKSLVHVIRNIIDHGLETPDERLELGKPEYCNVNCEIKLAGNAISLMISDDGRGFDFAKIRQKLTTRGLVSEEAACALADDDAVRLMIENHISTKDDVTYTSGRGLGLSAVKEETEKLGGTFTIVADRGKGTRFLFKLPYESIPEMSDLTAASIVDPLIETAKEFIANELDCKVISFKKSSISKQDSIRLKDFTCFIGIKGFVFGRFVVTMDRKLAEVLLEKLIIGELTKEEADMYIEDVLAETSNIIIGNSIKKFPGLEDLIVIEPPITLELSGAVVKFTESSSWSCSIESDYGSMLISFIVPYDSNNETNKDREPS
ncbi:MAG TPA: ATP-binding protein [Candidatus Nitrosocosmicus sp.]|nr:ATP-binding protein [Candidatus Nitrosocosmicus sp.]